MKKLFLGLLLSSTFIASSNAAINPGRVDFDQKGKFDNIPTYTKAISRIQTNFVISPRLNMPGNQNNEFDQEAQKQKRECESNELVQVQNDLKEKLPKAKILESKCIVAKGSITDTQDNYKTYGTLNISVEIKFVR